jgi:hypothetical protein
MPEYCSRGIGTRLNWLDILVRPTLDNAARLLEALEAFGFPVTDLSPEAIADRGC